MFCGSEAKGIASGHEEDLYSVFRARSELMGWATTSSPGHPVLWAINEAELTAGIDSNRIGWVQVGLEAGEIKSTRLPLVPARGYGYASLGIRRRATDVTVLLPPLMQCFADALRRFGDVAFSGFQVTANFLERDGPPYAHLVGMLNWFNLTVIDSANAVIAFDQEMFGGRSEAELVVSLRQKNTGSFEFGPVVVVPDRYMVKAGSETPIRSVSPARSGLGVSVTLPEWTASSAAWALAIVIDTALESAPDVNNFTVRVGRV